MPPRWRRAWKESHNYGKALVKPSIIVAAELVLGKDKGNMISQIIALSCDIVHRGIDRLSQDIKNQLLHQTKVSFLCYTMR